MADVVFGTTLLTGFLGGMVALLVPCCVSVMLPAFFAATFRTRSGVVAMTLVFATGVATVIVPISLGAAAAGAFLVRFHTPLYAAGGLAMLAAGSATLLGWKPSLPFAPSAPQLGAGPIGVYALGVFSGVASACCAPVLVGIAVLSSGSGSFPAALAIGLTYVIGMVAPLLALSLLWDRRDWGTQSPLARRSVRLRHRSVPLGFFLSGVVLMVMGILALTTAFTGPMPSTGWRLRVAAQLQHAASVATDALGWVPGWAVAVLLVAVGILLARHVRNGRLRPDRPQNSSVERNRQQAATDAFDSMTWPPGIDQQAETPHAR